MNTRIESLRAYRAASLIGQVLAAALGTAAAWLALSIVGALRSASTCLLRRIISSQITF